MIGWEAGVSNLASCLLFFFFLRRKLGLERWLPPRAFVLGVVLSALFLGPSFSFSCVRLSCLSSSVVFVSLSLSLCRRCAAVLFGFFRALASCWCSCRGGVSLAWVVMYVAVSVSSLLLSPALKKAREVLACATHACFFFSLSRPLASGPCCFLSCCASLFLVHAHAQRRRPVGLGFTSSCVAALLSQDPLGVGPPALPWFGSCCPQHG